VTFSEAVSFTTDDVTVQEVTFPGGAETLGAVLTPTGITGSGTDTMTITFDSASVLDRWVKVTLDGTGSIEDLAGNVLDGEAPAGGSGRGYIYDSDVDLPTGDGAAGGDAIFYVGSLQGDLHGDSFFDGEPNGVLNSLDIAAFIDAYQSNNMEADFHGDSFFDPVPNGQLNSLDIAAFIDVYQAAASLDELPATIGDGPLGAGGEVLGMAGGGLGTGDANLGTAEPAAEMPEAATPAPSVAEDTNVAAASPPAESARAAAAAYAAYEPGPPQRASAASSPDDGERAAGPVPADSLAMAEPPALTLAVPDGGAGDFAGSSERAILDQALADAEANRTLVPSSQTDLDGGWVDVLSLADLVPLGS